MGTAPASIASQWRKQSGAEPSGESTNDDSPMSRRYSAVGSLRELTRQLTQL